MSGYPPKLTVKANRQALAQQHPGRHQISDPRRNIVGTNALM
jgi:hypothetical protein